jgi:hypothetical protein
VSRHRASRNPGIEALEGRVVPSTIPVTSLADAGAGTLRAAIIQANLDATPDTITFDPSARGTITLVSALPDLSTAIDIEGPGPSVLTVARSSAPTTPEFRIFTVPAGAVVTISGLTISGGVVRGSVGDPGGDSFGGGVYNAGMLTVTDSTLSGNTASGGNGGGFGDGGSGYGGGVDNAGTLTVTDSTLSGNTASGGNGDGYGGGGSGYGGGVFNEGTLTVTDSTLSGNTARGGVGSSGFGGGVYNGGVFNTDALTVTRSISSIFFNPSGGNLVTQAGAAFVSGGHNLFSDTPAVTLASTDLINTDPLLGPLADNGGPTFTQILLPGSPAIDAGVSVPGVTTDQRGIPRPQGRAADIGAVEDVQATVTGLHRYGIHDHPTSLLLNFSAAINPASAQYVHNYTIVPAGHAGRVAPHARPIPIASALYDPVAHTVRLTPRHRLNLHGYYRLTVSAALPNGLKSLDGIPLDGSDQGQPGSNYVAVVHKFGTSTIQAKRVHPTGVLKSSRLPTHHIHRGR